MPPRQRQAALSGNTRKVPERADFDGHLGLGLPIVAEIVRRHQGHMALLDANPCGLIVRIVLPRTLSSGASRPDTMGGRRHADMLWSDVNYGVAVE